MSQYKIKPIYDLKDVKLPKVWGRPLKALASLVGSPYTNSLVKHQLQKEGGLDELRATQVDTVPMMMPKHPMVQRAKASEIKDSVPRFLKRMQEQSESAYQSEAVYRSVVDYARAYKIGNSSPTEVAERLIDALNAQKQGINAITHFNEQYIRLQAEESTQRLQRGEARSLLEGVPISVKDELDAVPYCTSVGTQIYGQDGSCQDDATVVARLRAAGCIIIGKANMHEIGIDLNGFNPHAGLCRNPYNSAHHTGGSSSGSAAAVAAGLGPLSIGADGGGSIRLPAALCGQVGLKSTWSRVSEHGAAPLCWSLAHVGPIGTCVDDVALAYLLMAGPDPLDNWSMAQPELHLAKYLNHDLSQVKIGVFSPWFEHADKEVVAACRTGVQHLEKHGAKVEEVYIDKLNAQRIAHAVTITTEMLTAVEKEYHATPMKFSAATRIALGFASAFTSTDYVKAQRIRAFAIEEFNRVFEEVDVIITPSSPITAPLINEKSLPEGESDFATATQLMRFMTPSNLTGHPALSVPVGYDKNGLPIGMQIIGRAWEEHLLLRMGKILEQYINKRKPEVLYRLLE